MTTPDNPFAAPPPGQPPYAAPPDGARPYPPPSGYGPPPLAGSAHPAWYGAPQTETKAVIALGLAIAAFTPTIPFIGAIAALVVAHLARRDILASGGRLTGLSLCTWAVVLSWVHLALVGLLFVFVVAAFLLPFSLLWIGLG